MRDPQPNGSARNARQLQSEVIPSRGRAVCLRLRAMHQRPSDPLFTSVYERHIERVKHHLVALTHMTNKMLHVVRELMLP